MRYPGAQGPGNKIVVLDDKLIEHGVEVVVVVVRPVCKYALHGVTILAIAEGTLRAIPPVDGIAEIVSNAIRK